MEELAQQGETLEKEESTSRPEESMSALVKEFDMNRLHAGDVVEGTIVSVQSDAILVDVGVKTEGIISHREVERMSKEDLEALKPGEKILVYVVRPEDREGNLILSIAKAEQEHDWLEAEHLYKDREAFEAPVAGFNRGGLIVKMGRLRGFVPASQLAPAHKPNGDSNELWKSLVSEKLFLKIIELDRKRNRLILSERAALGEWRRAQKEKLLETLQKGEIRHGRVTSIAPFGAFVDLGGADGLVHVSEISWSRVKHPSEAVKVGQEVDVYVLNVDREKKRIGLSIRRAMPNPWDSVVERYAVGQVVDAVITNLTDFGAFARLEQGIEGLIHISELADRRVDHPREVVKPGQDVTVRIIKIDPKRKRIGLSIRLVPEDKYTMVDWDVAESPQEEEVVTVMEETIAASQRPERAAQPEEPAAEAEAEETAAPAEAKAEETAAPAKSKAEETAAPAGAEAEETVAPAEAGAEETVAPAEAEAEETAAVAEEETMAAAGAEAEVPEAEKAKEIANEAGDAVPITAETEEAVEGIAETTAEEASGDAGTETPVAENPPDASGDASGAESTE